MHWTHQLTMLLAAALLGAALAIFAVWLRRVQLIGHRPGTFRCRVGPTVTGPWRSGLAQYSSDRLSWWPRFSLGGAEHWQRDRMRVAARADGLPGPAGERMLVLTCRVSEPDRSPADLYLLLDAASSAGLTSWLEAAPGRPHPVI